MYATVGNFVLTVVVTDAVGATASSSWAVTVVPAPSIQIVRSLATTDVGVPVAFDAVISGGSGSNDSGFWDFGDGTTSSGFNVTHVWTAPGVYNVSVTYVDGMGASTNASTVVRVNAAPVGEFSVSGGSLSSPAVPGTVFEYNATILYGTGPFNITWSFGDDTYAVGARVAHAYASNGTYSV
ncbi:surface layer protein, partial [mine drainage metagenome]